MTERLVNIKYMSPRTPEQFEQMREERRESIINAALELFARKGVDHTTISAIAKEADISKGLIYNYFDSKEQLLEEVINQGFAEMPLFNGTPSDAPPKETFNQLMKDLYTSVTQHRIFWQFYTELLLQVFRNPELADHFAATYRQFIGTFTEVLRRGGVPGPELEARKLASLLDGMMLHYLYDEDYPLQAIYEDIVETYTSMMHS